MTFRLWRCFILDVVFCNLDGVLGIWDGVSVIWFSALGIFDGVRMHCNGVHNKYQQLPSRKSELRVLSRDQSLLCGRPPGEEVQAPQRETKIWTVTAWGALRLVATVNSGRAPLALRQLRMLLRTKVASSSLPYHHHHHIHHPGAIFYLDLKLTHLPHLSKLCEFADILDF